MRSYLQSLIVPVCLTIILSPLVFVAAKPDRPERDKKEKEIPDLGLALNDTNWGIIHQDRR